MIAERTIRPMSGWLPLAVILALIIGSPILFIQSVIQQDGNFLLGSRRTAHFWKRDSLSIPTPYRTPAADVILPPFCQITFLHGTILHYGGAVMSAAMSAATDCDSDWGYR